MEAKYLLVGLGNPGKRYEGTRHNIGADVVREFAKKHGLSFKSDLQVAKGAIAEGKWEEKEFILLLPLQYMNESGISVGATVRSLRLAMHHILVVCDEIHLPFGQTRLRPKGSAGGHNGLKSVQMHLQSEEYPRLRMGVGREQEGEDLAEYVLAKFTQEEARLLPEFIDRGVVVMENWLKEGIEQAMRKANLSQMKGEDK